MKNEIIARALSANITADGTSAAILVEDMGAGKHVIVSEEVNAGNVTIQLQWSPDGTHYYAFSTAVTEGSTFPVVLPLIDSGGNDLPAKYLRAVTTNHTSTGENMVRVCGRQLEGWA